MTDQQGAVIPSVTVTVAKAETNVSNATKTNSVGYYRVEDLVPGTYSARFFLSGNRVLGN